MEYSVVLLSYSYVYNDRYLILIDTKHKYAESETAKMN